MQDVLTEISRPSPVCFSFHTGYNFHNSVLERKYITLGIAILSVLQRESRWMSRKKRTWSNLLALSSVWGREKRSNLFDRSHPLVL